MSRDRKRRSEDRKFKRLEIRYGPKKPTHLARAIQLSTTGAFLSASRPVYRAGSRIVIEMKIPQGTFLLEAIVRHAKSVPPQMIQLGRPGMGIEFLFLPPEVRKFLSTL